MLAFLRLFSLLTGLVSLLSAFGFLVRSASWSFLLYFTDLAFPLTTLAPLLRFCLLFLFLRTSALLLSWSFDLK